MLKKIKKDSKKINIHLGCGEKNHPDFINVDINYYPHIDYQTDVSNLSMFRDNYADLIYNSHTLEYFDREEAIKVLLEWKRVLKKGGICRIAVPNFAEIIKIYQNENDINAKGIIGPLFGRWKNHNDGSFLYHKTVYDFKSLKELLIHVGFKNIKRYDWKDTFHANLDDYSQAYIPHMDKENGTLISLNVEAEKT